MQTKLTEVIQASRLGKEAETILRKCVHCGFCTATCPTYQLFGDELDGPRGRIYLIKQVLEGAPATQKTLSHLDRCLTCRSCETTCPSGVEYGRLVEIGRHFVEQQVTRSPWVRVQRAALRNILPHNWIFTPLIRSGQAVRALLPRKLALKIPVRQENAMRPTRQHARKMILLEGCVQPGISPNINAASARVLDQLNIQLISSRRAGCCGAIKTHLSDLDGGLKDAKRNIDAWIPLLEAGAEALVMTASGCGSMIKEYGHMLSHDVGYASKAARISAATLDLCELLSGELDQLRQLNPRKQSAKIAYHAPCSLQHGQKITGKVEQILAAFGIQVERCVDSHLCCGSAGTYSILQPDISITLRDQKLHHLLATDATHIVSANIGCIAHLQTGTTKPVQHWIELIDQML